MGDMNKILKTRCVAFAGFLDDLKIQADMHFNGPRFASTEELYDLFCKEETEPVNRLSEIVGKWPGDESAEEIIEGIKGEPQTNEGVMVTREVTKNAFIKRFECFDTDLSDNTDFCFYEQGFADGVEQFIQPLQKKVKELTERNQLLEVADHEFNRANKLEAKISSLKSEIEKYQTFWNNLYTEHKELQSENERLKKQLEEKDEQIATQAEIIQAAMG